MQPRVHRREFNALELRTYHSYRLLFPHWAENTFVTDEKCTRNFPYICTRESVHESKIIITLVNTLLVRLSCVARFFFDFPSIFALLAASIANMSNVSTGV